MEIKSSPLEVKDTFLYIANLLRSHEALELRKVCKTWKRFIDAGQWNWEIVSEFSGAQYWHFKLGKTDLDKRQYLQKYSLVTQLGRFWHPRAEDACFVLVRADNCIEVKQILDDNNFKLLYVTEPQPAPMTVVYPLSGGMYVTGDKKGCVAVWNTLQPKEIRRFQAHASALSAIYEVSNKEIISATEEGEVTCWTLFENGQSKKWTIKDNLPVRTIQRKNNEIQVVYENAAQKLFSIKFYSRDDGSEKKETSTVKFGMMASMHQLSQVLFFKNRFLIEMRHQKRITDQLIYVCNNKRNPESNTFQPKTEKFNLTEKGNAWLEGFQTYILSNGNFLFHSVADGSAVLGIPKRLPLTLGEESYDPVLTINNK